MNSPGTHKALPISVWFRRHTVWPLAITALLFVLAIAVLLVSLVAGKRDQNDESAMRLMHMAQLATLQRNRPFLESLAELGYQDIGLVAIAICEGQNPLFVHPAESATCDLQPGISEHIITQPIPGLEETAISMILPRYPGIRASIFGFLFAGFFVGASGWIYRGIGSRLRQEILQPILAGVQDESQLASLRGRLRVAELADIFAAYEQKLAELRTLAEENARSAEEAAVARTAQSLAHDLKNPLALFEVALGTEALEEFQKYKPALCRAFERIHSILRNIGRRQANLAIHPTHTRLALESVASQFAVSRGGSAWELTVSGDATDAEVYLDWLAIEQCLVNLISNAREAGATAVEIQAWARSQDLLLQVIDNGPGVPEVLVPKLFERGQTFGKAQGEGLGLHNVKTLVQAHGGSAKYTREGEKSIFSLVLPQALASASAVPPSEQPTSATSVPSCSPLGSESPEVPSILVALSSSERRADLIGALGDLEAQVWTDPAHCGQPTLVYTDTLGKVARFVSAGALLVLDTSATPPAAAARQIRVMIQGPRRGQARGGTL